MLNDKQLSQLLLQTHLLDEKGLASAADFSEKNKVTLYQAVLQLELVDDAKIAEQVAGMLKLPFVVLTRTAISPEVINIIPEKIAQSKKAITFARSEREIKIAMANPSDQSVAQVVQKKTGLTPIIYYATDDDIDHVISMYRKDLQKKFEVLVREGLGTSTFATVAVDPPIEKILFLLVSSAYEQKASDIHIEPKENESLVRFRVDGILYDSLHIPLQLHDRIVTRIKVLSNLRTDEHLSAQDGKMQVTMRDENLDLRISILPISDGEKVVMRLLSSRSRSFSLTDLGMNEADLAKLTRAFQKPNGMILSTGPTGSGKTTTIYAILKMINTRDKNITSVEDPVEYKIKGANQVQVNTKTNLTFANGLRSILRQDPDYIFVGEIRDNETASIAVNAALTGHLVFSTLHTNDAPSAVPRLIDMKVEPFLVASTVNVVVAQRLVRKVCESCRHSYTMSKEEMMKLIPQETIEKHYIPVGKNEEVRLYQGAGCKVCNFTGFTGRVGIFELFEVTKAIRELITDRADADVIREAALKEGMASMLDDGVEKMTKGLTTIEEVLGATKQTN